MSTSSAPPVPAFLELAAHPVRWQLLVELARSDRLVSELTTAVARPQALVSYHLGRLRTAGVVSARRSSFDGRAAYYGVRLDRCGELLAGVGAALHPGLRTGPAARPTHRPLHRRGGRRWRVLVTCTGNATRSQLAEALLRARSGGSVDVVSAGSHPRPIHPNTITVLAERGIDTSALRSTSLDELAGRRFDLVVTLCDRVREVCPEFAGEGERVHWSLEDPSRLPGTTRAVLPAFRALADELETRIDFLCARLAADPTPHHHTHDRESHHGRSRHD